VRVFSSSTTGTFGHGIILLYAHVNNKPVSASGLVGDVFVGPQSATLQAAQRCHFLETVLMSLGAWQRWFQLDAAQAHCREGFRQWLNATYPGGWTGHRGVTCSVFGRRL
jgi:hypothetical protein